MKRRLLLWTLECLSRRLDRNAGGNKHSHSISSVKSAQQTMAEQAPTVKSLQKYITQAARVQKVQPLVAYYCKPACKDKAHTHMSHSHAFMHAAAPLNLCPTVHSCVVNFLTESC